MWRFTKSGASAAFRAMKATGKVVIGGTTAAAVIGGCYILSDADRRLSAGRSAKITIAMTPIYLDYRARTKAKELHGEESEEYKAISTTFFKNSAERLLALSNDLGGVWTKFSQQLSTYNHVVPAEAVLILSQAQDKAGGKPWSDVKSVIQEDFGLDATQVFASIEEQPVAAASLAQVHRAVTKEGRDVAVKIQYPNLRKEARVDTAALRLIVKLMAIADPTMDYEWLLREFADALLQELNFLQEAANGERTAAMFAGDARYHVPAVLRALSSERVLCMEWIDGVKVTDVPALKERIGVVDTREVANAVCEFFGQQVFVHGFLHADLHPGNIMVRRRPHADDSPDPHGAWQVVILDHGMYRRTSAHFRRSFAGLFKALVLGEEGAATAAVQQLGMHASNLTAMSLVLVYRPPRSGFKAAMGGRWSEAEFKKIKAGAEKIDVAEVQRFLQRLPRDIFYVLRAVNMVRGINFALGGTSQDRFHTFAQCAVQGLRLEATADAGAAEAAAAALQADQEARGLLTAPAPVAGADGAALAPEQEAAQRDADRRADQLSELKLERSVQGSGNQLEGIIDADSPGEQQAGAGDAAKQWSPPDWLPEWMANFAKGVQAVIKWYRHMASKVPVYEPLTYANALARGSVVSAPTDSELSAAADAAQRERSVLGYIASRVSRSLGQTVDMLKVKAVLTIYGLIWKLFLAFGPEVKLYSDPQRPHRMRDPG